MKVINIGRQPGNDVIVHDEAASRYHLQIVEFDDGSYHLIDLGSTNGTYVNGLRIDREVILNDSDFVRIGDTMLPWKYYFSPDFVSQAQENLGDMGPTKEREIKKPKLHNLMQAFLWIVGIGSLLWACYVGYIFGKDVSRMIKYGYFHWTILFLFFHLAAIIVMGVGALVLLTKRSKKGLIMMAIAAVLLLVLFVVDWGTAGWLAFMFIFRIAAILLSVGLTCSFLALKKENLSGWKNVFDK